MAITLNRKFLGSGPERASIVVLSECKMSFDFGVSKVLLRAAKEAGLSPSDVRFEFVCQRECVKNTILSLPESERVAWEYDAQQRIQEINPKVVVSCGERTTKIFLPNTKISEQHCYVQQIKQTQGKSFWLVPSYSTSHIIRGNWKDTFWLRLALSKARELSSENPPKDVEHELIIAPTREQVSSFFAQLDAGSAVACDIEKTQTNEISCISFADRPDHAISVPFIADGHSSFWSPSDERKIWALVASFLGSETPKVFHNHIFDVLVFSYFGISVDGPIHDTMTLAHLLHPELPKGLSEIGRIHTWGPEWKSVGKDWKNVRDWVEHWTYNAMDSARTIECFGKQKAILEACGRWEFYEKHLLPLGPVVYSMCARGWMLDKAGIKGELKTTELEMSKLKNEISAFGKMVGIDEINPGSSKQLKEFALASGWKVPKKKGSDSMDEVSRAKMYVKYKHPVFPLIDEYKTLAKYRSSYLKAKLDFDDKYRFSIIIPGTVTSRFSSSQTPWDTGGNSQNIPPRFRKFVVAERGKVLINTDLDRADAQVVARLAKDKEMLRVLSSGEDMHVTTANSIFGVDITTLPEDEYKTKRKLGKKANHALNYGMHAKRFAEDVLKDTGISITLAEATKIVNGYFKAYPGILEWHAATEASLRKSRSLTSPHGRVRVFLGLVDDKMFRDAYAWIPPTTVGDALNVALLNFCRIAKKEHLMVDVLGQKHDSLLLQVDESVLDIAVDVLDAAMKSSVFYINEMPCCIPHGVEVGHCWGDMAAYERGKK